MTTLLELQPIALPLTVNADGVVRVGGTRVTLDTVVRAFLRGAAAEEIAQQYPSLSLADVYATISYYLHYRTEVEKYLEKRAKYAKSVRQQNEKRFDQSGIRARLLAQKKQIIMLLLVSDENFNNDITRGLPHLRVLRQIMGEIYRLFDRRCCTATALSKLAILRKRVQRFTKRMFLGFFPYLLYWSNKRRTKPLTTEHTENTEIL